MFDTEKLAMKSWEKVLLEAGLNIELNELNKMKGLSFENSEKVMKKIMGRDFPFKELCIKKEQYMLKDIEENGLAVKGGLYGLIDLLEQKNILKAVATSTMREKAEKLLGIANVINRFEFIICGDEITKGKPDPEIFITAVKKAGCPANECLVLEDSGNGIIAAARAGTKAIFIKDVEDLPVNLKSRIYKEFNSLSEFSNYIKPEI